MLATGALIKASLPWGHTQGTDLIPLANHRYVLLHHVMGELEGQRGAWGYVAGGMGALSQAIASAAATHGAHIFTEQVWGFWSW